MTVIRHSPDGSTTWTDLVTFPTERPALAVSPEVPDHYSERPPERPGDRLRPWNKPGDYLYRRSGVYAVRYMWELIYLPSDTWMNPMAWYAEFAEPGPWSWLQPAREKVGASA